MNVACVIQAGCRMSLQEIFLRLPMRKTSLVRSLPAVLIRPNFLNPLLPCLHHGELSARSGEALQKAFADKEELLKQQAETLHDQKKAGLIFEAEEVISLLTSVLKQSPSPRVNLSSRHQFAPGATALYKGDKMVLNLDRSRIPVECIEKIEAILKELEKPGV